MEESNNIQANERRLVEESSNIQATSLRSVTCFTQLLFSVFIAANYIYIIYRIRTSIDSATGILTKIALTKVNIILA